MIDNLTEAIRYFRQKARNIFLGETFDNYGKLAAWLEELAKRREAGRWIPVSEKLPEKDGRFLVCTSSGEVDTNAFMFGQFTRPYVIAWKHLPEPYDWRAENEC